MNKKELNEKYVRILNWQDEYYKELREYINEAFAMHGNEFEYKCPTHPTWQKKNEDGDDEFYAMEDLPVYLACECGRSSTDELYPYRIYQEVDDTGMKNIFADGYEWNNGEWWKDCNLHDDTDSLESIASFINAVLEQETEGQEEEEDAPTTLCMEDYEKGEALMRKDGFFSITSVHRDDLSDNGFDASAVTDAQMKELAKRMCEDYLEQMFFQSLRDIAEIMGIPKLTL